MAKKRKAGRFAAGDEAPGFEPKGGKLGPIATYEDVADSEDEFHINRDKVLLDERPEAKRRRKWAEEDAELEPSDEEILAYSESSDEGEDDADIPQKPKGPVESDDEEEHNEEEEEEGWGTSRKDYYNADEIQTEADALEEEAEAKRIQQKKLQKMTEADFGFDESEWLEAANDEDEGDVITEVLKDVEITPEMGPEERLRILNSRYPEFEFLANEFVALQPVLVELQEQLEDENVSKKSSGYTSVTVIKCRALAAYMASLTMYFAILTSPAKNGASEGKALAAAELRDHPVMDSLLQCRKLWVKVKLIKTPEPMIDESKNSESEPEVLSTKIDTLSKNIPQKLTKQEIAFAKAEAERAKRLEAAEADLQSLDNLLPKSRKSKSSAVKTRSLPDDDSNSDFGEETHLSTRAAAEKASRKKTLKFYTSQIAQKANKRAGAGRDAGGDEDLPYKERLRDRQARLNAEAEKRGKKLDEYGRGAERVELGGESDGDENDKEVAKGVRAEEDEYYDLVSKSSKKKKSDKEEKMEILRKAKEANAIVRFEEDGMDEDGKRAIGYVIEKNKGLAPKRKKDVRNPRVKKRKKFEEKKKKLGSMKAVYKGGEERGGYGGEKTGIKSGLVKSIKL